ncbi:MAG TPA: hypothetical protein VM008_07485 [Phycisphaerae bacterium]|nr:hypothetical protein [Phycisphaerae bacterium]
MAWIPYVALAALAGIVNIANAWKQLAYDCRFLVFFRAHRVFAVYLWSAAQLVIPAALAWIVLGYSNRPPVNYAVLLKAIGFGVGFVALMNASTEVAGFNIDILRKIYHGLIYAARQMIAARETARTAQFWQNLEVELRKVAPASLTIGFDFLHKYVENDISLSPEVRAATLDAIDKVMAIPAQPAQGAQIKSVLTVRRKDLPLVLQKFGCGAAVVTALLS